MSLDNGNAGVVWCQLSKWIEQDVLQIWFSINMIKDLHLGVKHLVNHCNVYIYIYASGIYAAVDFSYDMTYSGTGTMLHLVLPWYVLLHTCCLMPPQKLIQDGERFQALQNLGGDIGDIRRWFINVSLHCLRKKDYVKTTNFWEMKLHGWWTNSKPHICLTLNIPNDKMWPQWY